MKMLINYTFQISLFILFGAAYAQIVSTFAPLYIFNETIRETLFLVIAAVSSLISVQFLKNIFGISTK